MKLRLSQENSQITFLKITLIGQSPSLPIKAKLARGSSL
jgi:hypothetical protein